MDDYEEESESQQSGSRSSTSSSGGGDVLALGSYLTCPPVDLLAFVSMAAEIEQDFVVVPVTHPRYRRDSIGVSRRRIDALGRSELLLDARDWSSNIVGRASSWLSFEPGQQIRASEEALLEEFEMCSHLGLQAMIIDCPSSTQGVINFSRQLLALADTALSTGGVTSASMQLWVRLPLNKRGWQQWQLLSSLTGHHYRIFLSLYLDGEELGEDFLQRWASARIKGIEVGVGLYNDTSSSFSSSSSSSSSSSVAASKKAKGDKKTPKLSLPEDIKRKLHFFMELFEQLHVFVSGKPRHGDNCYDFSQYLSVISTDVWEPHCDAKRMMPSTDYDQFCNQYKDSLRLPLQPLKDSLETNTYRVMEMDPVKYAQYDEAIFRAVVDICKSAANEGAGGASAVGGKKKERSIKGEAKKGTHVLIVVIGPGRGPLIAGSIKAARRTGADIKIVAIEKNKNAVFTLRNRARDEPDWKGVDIIHGDVRTVELPESVANKADIIVSELLGSWGDNEASPECLDIARRRLLKQAGVCIPCKYTSWCAPVCSPKLWISARDIFQGQDRKKGTDGFPFVVHFHHVNVLADALPLFEFSHPPIQLDAEALAVIDNNREKTVSFSLFGNQEKGSSSKNSNSKSNNSNKRKRGPGGGATDVDADKNGPSSSVDETDVLTVHGLAGYFDCCLYKDVSFSTVPHSFSSGMYSWFPMFVPFESPVMIRKDSDALTVSVWRRSNGVKMWYEMAVSSPSPFPILNVGGRSFSVDLQ